MLDAAAAAAALCTDVADGSGGGSGGVSLGQICTHRHTHTHTHTPRAPTPLHSSPLPQTLPPPLHSQHPVLLSHTLHTVLFATSHSCMLSVMDASSSSSSAMSPPPRPVRALFDSVTLQQPSRHQGQGGGTLGAVGHGSVKKQAMAGRVQEAAAMHTKVLATASPSHTSQCAHTVYHAAPPPASHTHRSK